ncbi:MAG: Guanyl-specific ribonuclease, partial [uncultured Friedmanniella sp.]
ERAAEDGRGGRRPPHPRVAGAVGQHRDRHRRTPRGPGCVEDGRRPQHRAGRWHRRRLRAAARRPGVAAPGGAADGAADRARRPVPLPPRRRHLREPGAAAARAAGRLLPRVHRPHARRGRPRRPEDRHRGRRPGAVLDRGPLRLVRAGAAV